MDCLTMMALTVQVAPKLASFSHSPNASVLAFVVIIPAVRQSACCILSTNLMQCCHLQLRRTAGQIRMYRRLCTEQL